MACAREHRHNEVGQYFVVVCFYTKQIFQRMVISESACPENDNSLVLLWDVCLISMNVIERFFYKIQTSHYNSFDIHCISTFFRFFNKVVRPQQSWIFFSVCSKTSRGESTVIHEKLLTLKLVVKQPRNNSLTLPFEICSSPRSISAL